MRKGFTLLELLLTIAIIAIVSVLIFATLAGRRKNADLIATTQEAGAILRQAQSDAMAQENNAQANDAAWGVHFANATATRPFYALFSGSYAVSTTVGYYALPLAVAYITSTLPAGATLDIIFSPVTGIASTSTNIGFYMPGQSAAFSSTISVASSGAVRY